MEPTAPGDSWRTWLMTGSRGAGADRRRVRGAHRGLKKILIEGTTNGGEPSRPWNDFSGAMVRQAVNEAVNQLPPDHKQVVRLAYFGGLSNREIAQHLGLSVGGVERRLRLALARVSEHVEHGRSAGRRAFVGLVAWLAGRQLLQAMHRAPAIGGDDVIRAAAVLATGVVAATALAAQPALPGNRATFRPHSAVVATNASRQQSTPVVVNAPVPAAVPAAVFVAPNAAKVAPALPVKVPPLPALPVPALPKLIQDTRA